MRQIPVDPQREIILAAVADRLMSDPDVLALLGDEPRAVCARRLRRDPVRIVDRGDGRADVQVEGSALPCVAVYPSPGAVQWEGEGNRRGWRRQFTVEWCDNMPAAMVDYTAGELGELAAGIMGAKITQHCQDPGTINATIGIVDLYGAWISEVRPVSYETYSSETARVYGVEVTVDVWCSEEFPPFMVLDESVWLQTVTTEQRWEAPDESEIEHDGEHQITQP